MIKKVTSAAMTSARLTYSLELARGRSHIGSTLTASTRELAIAEVVLEFCGHYGERDLALFRQLLVEDLQQRGNREAASAVREFKFPKSLV